MLRDRAGSSKTNVFLYWQIYNDIDYIAKMPVTVVNSARLYLNRIFVTEWWQTLQLVTAYFLLIKTLIVHNHECWLSGKNALFRCFEIELVLPCFSLLANLQWPDWIAVFSKNASLAQRWHHFCPASLPHEWCHFFTYIWE